MSNCVDEAVAVARSKFVFRHVVKQSLDVVRGGVSCFKNPIGDEMATHILQDAYHRLQPFIGVLVLRRKIFVVLFWIVVDSNTSRRKKTDAVRVVF